MQRGPVPLGARLAGISTAIPCVLASLVLAALGAASLFVSARFDAVNYSEMTTLVPLNPILAALCGLTLLAACLLAVWPLFRVQKTAPGRAHRFAQGYAVAAALLVAAGGVAWTLSLNGEPRYDQQNVWKTAQYLAKGCVGSFPEEYLQASPYQVNTAYLLEVLIRLFGDDATPMFGIFGSACAAAAVLALCGICWQLSGDAPASGLCAVLCVLFLPLVFYCAFVYGTLPAPAFALCGAYCAVRLAKGGRLAWALGAWTLLPLAALIYSSMQVAAVAVFLVLLCTGLGQGRRKALRLAAVGALTLAFSLGIGTAAHLWFCARSGQPWHDGMPVSAFVAMGVTSTDGVNGPGSYNDLNWSSYWENGGDTAATDEAMRELIGAAVSDYLANPAKAVAFFAEKTARQWLDPWASSLIMCYDGVSEEAGALVRAVGKGALFAPIQQMLTSLLSLLYLGGAAGCVYLRRKNRCAVWAQLPGVIFLGGFLLQLVWESKGRYCFPYLLAILPAAAIGLAAAGRAFGRCAEKIRSRRA